ncbi:hypothetical protein LPC08_23410 [Roseomonas sp. OT10]|uniref:hypothetical protein n=1 Tax=Roseomonas cutis TaxID=2897332 RepID=UPI001E568EBA|nr:hypothetical protein [Roseomonas sp. OT10]UFN48909.1 hypothetical protein LPC08_23410 [Roseomonas sp. OT10]
MAEHAHSTPAPRREARHRAALSRRAQRAALENIVTRALAMLDALDGDPDLEPEGLEDDDLAEVSAQPVTLAADRVPAVVVRFPRRGGQLGKFAEFLASPASKCKFALCSSGALPPPPAFRPEGGR